MCDFSDFTRCPACVRNAPKRMSATLNLWVHDLRVHALASLDASGHFNSQRGTGSTYWIVPIDRQLILSDTGNQFDFPCVISLAKAFKFAKSMRRELDFMSGLNVIWVVQSFSQKYFTCAVGQINSTDSSVLTR